MEEGLCWPTPTTVVQDMAGHKHQPDRYGPENAGVSDDYDDEFDVKLEPYGLMHYVILNYVLGWFWV